MFGLIIQSIVLVILIRLFKGNIELVLTNLNKIESLEAKRNPNFENLYNFGRYFNFTQVFGKNKLMWIFPFFTERSKPIGDGINWL